MKYTANLNLRKPDKEDFYDVDDFNYNADILDIANFAIVNKTVAVADWQNDTTYANYPYRADIAIETAKAEHVPDVAFGLDEATSGNFAPVAEAHNGGVYIYASSIPQNDIVVKSIVLSL